MATGNTGTALCEEIAGDGLAAYGRDIAAQPDVASVIARAVELAPKVIDCRLVDVVRVGESGVLTVIGSSDPGSSAQLVRAAAASEENPASSCRSAPGRAVTSDIADEDRWLGYARTVFEATGLRSEISVGSATADETTLVMRFFSEQSKPWTEIQQCDVAAFVDLSALAIDRAVLRAVASNLRQALTGNRVIATAVGILMHRHRLDQAEAFDMLRTRSQNSNRKIRSIADEVVSTGALPDAPQGRRTVKPSPGSRHRVDR